MGLELGQPALGISRVKTHQTVTDQKPQNRVSQKLELLVIAAYAARTSVRSGGLMGKSAFQQLRVREPMVENSLQSFPRSLHEDAFGYCVAFGAGAGDAFSFAISAFLAVAICFTCAVDMGL